MSKKMPENKMNMIYYHRVYKKKTEIFYFNKQSLLLTKGENSIMLPKNWTVV